MGRPKSAKPKPAEIPAEEESQELPDEEPETEDDEPEASGKAISKAAAVRDALEQGEDSPEDGVAYIKKIHGIEMTRQMFSSYKAQQKARDAKKEAAPKGKPGRKPKAAAAPAIEGYLAPPPKPAPPGGSDLLDAMEAMKPLIASLGKEQVHRIIDLLG